MKFSAYYLAAGAFVLLSACGKDDDSKQPSTTPSPRLTATVDGTSWTSSTTSQALTQGQVQFSGRNAAGDFIELFMEPVNGPVTITSADTGTYILGRYESASGAEWKTNMPGGSATISVVSFDPTTKLGAGTFSFTAPGSTSNATGVKTVTNGTFKDIKLSM